MKKVLRFILNLILSTLIFLAVVPGGLTLLLILVPLFGYIPYSDRPGPGWYGKFPAMSLDQFWTNAIDTVGIGAFYAVFLALGGLLVVVLIRVMELFKAEIFTVRIIGGFFSAVVTAYFSAAAGWYFAMGYLGWITTIVLGALAGSWLLPRKVAAKEK